MSQAAVIEVRCVLIPLVTSRLLLPNAVVAEVMNFRPQVSREQMPEWFLGDLAWRGGSVPLVSIEGMLGGSVASPGQRSRIIVLNTLNGTSTLPHIALLAQAIPTLVRVTMENLEPSKIKSDLGDLIQQSVTVNAGLALIPDLDELERQVQGVISQPPG